MSQEPQPVETLGVTRDGRPGLIVPLVLPYHLSVQLLRDHTHTQTHTQTLTETQTHTHTHTDTETKTHRHRKEGRRKEE